MPVPAFTAGEILTAANMNEIGLWLVKTQTVGSAVSTVTVSDVFSSTYDSYLVVLNDISASAGDRIRLTINGSAGSTYRYGGFRSSYSAAVIDSEQGNNLGYWVIALPGAAGKVQGTVVINNPNKAQPTSFSSAFGGPTFSMSMNGYDTNTAASTGFLLDPESTGTLTGGTIKVYGYRN
jgi:hypothetical protein